MKNRQLKVTYSEAFKQKVVNQIENGILTKSEARRLYDIGGALQYNAGYDNMVNHI